MTRSQVTRYLKYFAVFLIVIFNIHTAYVYYYNNKQYKIKHSQTQIQKIVTLNEKVTNLQNHLEVSKRYAKDLKISLDISNENLKQTTKRVVSLKEKIKELKEQN